jgi:tripartite-type tricarboxylate transporter receptor subunit TctC
MAETAASPSRRRLLAGALAGVALAGLPRSAAAAAAAASFPTRTVRLIVGQAPGGQTDTMARLVAPQFAARWNESVVIENHGGAAGTIAGRMVARAPADGHVLLVGSNATIASAALQAETAPYDPVRDWAPVGRIARVGYVLAVRPGLGAATVREFVELARARAEGVSLATVGAGSNAALTLTRLERATGVRILEVPYKGGAPGLQAVVAGQVDATFCDLALALPHVPAGTVRILATAGNRRLALAPDVPTFAEAGLPGIVAEPWYGIVAPAGTPPAVIAELSAALHAALGDEDIRRRFAHLGYETIIETPEAFATAIRSEAEQARGSRQP